MIQERLTGYIEQSIRQNWRIEALSNYKEPGYYKNEKATSEMIDCKFRIHPEEFVKTPKRSIKRFLYAKE